MDIIPGLIGAVFLPIIANISRENKDIEKFEITDSLNLYIPWLAVTIISIILISIPEILGLLYGGRIF